MDSTLSYKQSAQRNVDKSIKLGFKVTIYYIVLGYKTAYQKTKDRQSLIGRKITKDVFVGVCRQINESLLTIYKQHIENDNFKFICFDKGDLGEINSGQLKSIYNSDIAEDRQKIKKLLNREIDVSDLS